jgi:hypothetical protein
MRCCLSLTVAADLVADLQRSGSTGMKERRKSELTQSLSECGVGNRQKRKLRCDVFALSMLTLRYLRWEFACHRGNRLGFDHRQDRNFTYCSCRRRTDRQTDEPQEIPHLMRVDMPWCSHCIQIEEAGTEITPKW